LYERRYRPVDIADSLKLPDRIVMAAIHRIRAGSYSKRVTDKKARHARFLKRQQKGIGGSAGV
jgi:2,4-dienoyl-CoA reductase-like NADH-dependent reductase (Old Yellow Enzyme family)